MRTRHLWEVFSDHHHLLNTYKTCWIHCLFNIKHKIHCFSHELCEKAPNVWFLSLTVVVFDHDQQILVTSLITFKWYNDFLLPFCSLCLGHTTNYASRRTAPGSPHTLFQLSSRVPVIFIFQQIACTRDKSSLENSFPTSAHQGSL